MSKPFRVDANLYQNRDSIILHEQWTDPDGTPQDLTGATIDGAIKNEKSDASTLASLTFDNDLPNGIIKAYLALADYTTVAAGLTNGTGYHDIYVQTSGGLKEQYYEGEVFTQDTVA